MTRPSPKALTFHNLIAVTSLALIKRYDAAPLPQPLPTRGRGGARRPAPSPTAQVRSHRLTQASPSPLWGGMGRGAAPEGPKKP